MWSNCSVNSVTAFDEFWGLEELLVKYSCANRAFAAARIERAVDDVEDLDSVSLKAVSYIVMASDLFSSLRS